MQSTGFDPFRAMQLINLLMMAVLIGVRVMPPLRPYARALSIGMLLFYGIAIIGFYLWGFVL